MKYEALELYLAHKKAYMSTRLFFLDYHIVRGTILFAAFLQISKKHLLKSEGWKHNPPTAPKPQS